MAEWTTTTLGSIADIEFGNPFKSSDYGAAGSGPRLLRGDNIAQGRLRWDGAKHWPADKASGLERYALREGDVVLAMDRPWIDAGLKYARVSSADMPALLVQRVARLRGTDHIDAGYLRYLIGSRSFTDYVLGIQTGTAVPHISGGQIRAYSFRLPTVIEQRAMARILGSLDDKIEVNRRMNETLEAMARALFKSWFIDFDPVHAKARGERPVGMDTTTAALFPSKLIQSGHGEIPEGWSHRPLDSIATFLNGLALQKFPAGDGPALPVIKIAEMRAGVTPKSDRAAMTIPPQYIIGDGDLLFSWSGSLEIIIWTGGRGALNQHLFKVSSQLLPAWFLLGGVRQHLGGFQAIAASKATTMGHIQRHHLTEALVAVPPPDVLARAGNVLEPLHSRIIANSQEAKTLATLRDTLLPPLLSGELRVSKAERAAEAA